MKVPIPDHEIVSVVELLTAMADFCRAEAPVIGVALERFMGTDCYDASALREDILLTADYLAQAIGYPDSLMDPGETRADYDQHR